MKTEQKRRKYTQEFKENAVKLVTEQGYTNSKAARQLGINENLLCTWRKKLSDIENSNSITKDEREELKKLRREVRELKMEKEILKKASAYFAREIL